MNFTDYGETSNKFLDDKPILAIPHFLYPALNCSLKSGTKTELIQNNVLEYRSMPYKHTRPVPLNDPMMLDAKSIRGLDHVTKLISDKSVWENEKSDLINRNVKLKSSLCFAEDEIITNWKRVSRETVRLAEHIDNDPDPDFSGFYNWYYSDGCLNKIFHNNITSLLYANDSLPGTCIVTPLVIKNLDCSLSKDRSMFLNTGNDQNIFQIAVNNNLVAIRQKTFTSLFTTGDNELQFKKIHEHSETNDSILSVSISNDLEYCTLTKSHILKLWSPVVKDECVGQVNINKTVTSDCWGSAKYVSNNNILVSDREYVYLKDTRVKLNQNAQKWKVQVKEGPCNFISMLMKSHVKENCAYIGTIHHLYELDFRNGLSKQWTHMMEFPPMYGVSNLVSDVNETLFIGSQSVNEVCAINCDLSVMPFILPSPDETLTEANLQGLCLNPMVASRFNFSMTGLTTVSNSNRNNSAFIFRVTSTGDIFYQKAIHKDDCNNDSSHCSIDLDSLSEWEVKCEKPVDTVTHSLNVTDVIDFDKLIGNNNSKLLKFKKHLKHKQQESSESNDSDWMIPKRRVFEPRDKYSQSLADVWDMKIEDIEESVIVCEQGSHIVNDKSESKQYFCDGKSIDRQMNNNKHYEDSEKLLTESTSARKDTFQEQFSLEGSRISNLTMFSNSFDSGNGTNSDYLLNDSQNEGNCATANLSTPKKIAINEVKRKVKKRSRFSSGF